MRQRKVWVMEAKYGFILWSVGYTRRGCIKRYERGAGQKWEGVGSGCVPVKAILTSSDE